MAKDVLEVGTSSLVAGLGSTPPTSYGVQNDDEASASTEMTVSVYSRTADGEVPQLQVALKSSGGENTGLTNIAPGIEVSANVTISGAAITSGLVGTDGLT